MGALPLYRLGVHNNSLVNVMRGLKERVYKVNGPAGLQPPPKPDDAVFAGLDGFRRLLVKQVGRARAWTYDEFLLSCRPSKRTLYAQAVASLLQRPLSKEDARITTFVKAEKIDLQTKDDPAPRLIQPRQPRYNAWVGRYIKAAESRIYAAIDGVWGRETVMSGYNALDVARHLRGHWDQWDDTVAIGLDASRFDQHVSSQALEWEHSVYNQLYKCPKLREVLKWQLSNQCTALTPEGKVLYTVDGCRMSGDMNTSLGNKLIMCGLVWQYCQEAGVKATLANNGDDCVLFVRRRSVSRVIDTLPGWFLRYGFTMKVEDPVDVFEQIEFCQQRPVEVEAGRWLMTRSPEKGLAKDLMFIGPGTDVRRDYMRWAGGVGKAGLAAYGGVPIVQEVYRWMASLGPGRELDPYSGIGAASKNMTRTYTEPTSECRASYYLAWGISPVEQCSRERSIREALKTVPAMVESILQVDHLSIT